MFPNCLSSGGYTECQKLFSFLPLRYQVDIRTASFMLRFMATDNYICNLFALLLLFIMKIVPEAQTILIQQ